MRVITAVCVVSLCSPVRADDFLTLRENYRPGYQYHVSSRVELSGTLSLPPEKDKTPRPLAMHGQSAVEYDERILGVGNGEVEKTLRIYRRVEFKRTVGGEPQENTLRPEVRRLVLLRLKPVEVPFSPDGPLMWGEIDLVRTDVFTPALSGLLPREPVAIGARWTASDAAVQELTDLERIEEGKLECRLGEVTTLENRRLARINFTGSVAGVNEDGPNRQQLEGYCYFDLESQHVSYLYLKGTHLLLGKDGKESGRVEGRFVLTRQANTQSPDLDERIVRGLDTTPNDRNTLLLYEHPDLGVRFLHPRRWKVAGVRGRQVALDETNGNGLLLTLEPKDRVPTGAQFLAESRAYLEQQKVKIHREEPPRQLGDVEQFALDTEAGTGRAWLDYYVIRQAAGGATAVARLLPQDQANLRREVEALVRSITILKPPPAVKGP